MQFEPDNSILLPGGFLCVLSISLLSASGRSEFSADLVEPASLVCALVLGALWLHDRLDTGRKWKRGAQILITAVKVSGFHKKNRGQWEQSDECWGREETNAIKVRTQPELIEIKDLKQKDQEGGGGAAFTGAQAECENSTLRFVCRTDISSWLQYCRTNKKIKLTTSAYSLVQKPSSHSPSHRPWMAV